MYSIYKLCLFSLNKFVISRKRFREVKRLLKRKSYTNNIKDCCVEHYNIIYEIFTIQENVQGNFQHYYFWFNINPNLI